MFGFECFHLLYISRPTLGQTPSKICIFHNMFWMAASSPCDFLKEHSGNIFSKTKADKYSFLRTPTRSAPLLTRTSPTTITVIMISTEDLAKIGVLIQTPRNAVPRSQKNTDDALRQKKEKIENEESYIFEPELHRVVVFVVIPYTSKSSAHKDGTLPMRNNGNFN